MPVDVALSRYGGFHCNACCPSRLFTHIVYERRAVAVIQVYDIPLLQYIDEFPLDATC